MTHVFVRLIVLLAVPAFAIGCDVWPFGPSEPSKSVAGTWRFVESRSYVFEMTLSQDGDRISGDACFYPQGFLGPAPVGTTQVTGDYPRLRMAFNPSCEYDMRYEEDQDQIAGDCEGRRLVRFSRGGSGRCEGAGQVR